MKTAYSISITTRVRKSEDHTDKIGHETFINRVKYFQAFGKYVPVRSLATPMAQMCAMQLADQLKTRIDADAVIDVIDILTDDDQYLAANLDELTNGPVNPGESTALRNLKIAIEACFKDGMTQLDILSAVNKTVING